MSEDKKYPDNKTERIDVPDSLPENNGGNPNEEALEQHQHKEIPKVYGPARPHNIKRKISLKDKLPFNKDRSDVVVVYGPAEWFAPTPIVDDENKPDKPDTPDAE